MLIVFWLYEIWLQPQHNKNHITIFPFFASILGHFLNSLLMLCVGNFFLSLCVFNFILHEFFYSTFYVAMNVCVILKLYDEYFFIISPVCLCLLQILYSDKVTILFCCCCHLECLRLLAVVWDKQCKSFFPDIPTDLNIYQNLPNTVQVSVKS